jgi:hypothetical protein
MVSQNSKVARFPGIREQQDEWAARRVFRRRARRAGRGIDPRRRDTTVEKLAALAGLRSDGTTTAGNAPGVNDGASCVIVCSEAWAKQRGLEVLATILSQGYVADDFAYLARTPANAAAIALEHAGKTIGDVDRVEINEAFASVAWNSTRLLGADEEQVNVNGGAIALGHPIGASGGRIVGTMVHELRRSGGGVGLAAISLGRRPGRRAPPRGIRAAGGVVVRGDQVLVVHRARYDGWSLPKGKLEAGEDREDGPPRGASRRPASSAGSATSSVPRPMRPRRSRRRRSLVPHAAEARHRQP